MKKYLLIIVVVSIISTSCAIFKAMHSATKPAKSPGGVSSVIEPGTQDMDSFLIIHTDRSDLNQKKDFENYFSEKLDRFKSRAFTGTDFLPALRDYSNDEILDLAKAKGIETILTFGVVKTGKPMLGTFTLDFAYFDNVFSTMELGRDARILLDFNIYEVQNGKKIARITYRKSNAAKVNDEDDFQREIRDAVDSATAELWFRDLIVAK